MSTTTIGTIELIATIDTANYKKGASEIERANQKLEKSSGTASSTVDKTGAALRGMALRGLKVATVGALAFGTAITALTLKGGISRALNIEDAQAKLRGLGHDAKSVTTIMGNALSAVKGTAYGLDEAATTAATAVAAGIKPGKELTAYLKLTADAATIAGISMSDMGRTMNKVTTVNAAYNDSLLEVSEKGIPIYQLLSKEMGVSAEEVKKLASEGKVSAAVFRKALEQNIGGAALESGKTTRGSLANMGAAFSRLGAQIVEDFVPKFRGAIQGVSQFVDENSANIVNGINSVISAIARFGTTAANTAKQLWTVFGPSLIALANVIQTKLWPQIMALWDAVNPGLTEAVKILAKALGVQLVAMIWITINAWNVILTVIGAVIRVISNLIKWAGNAAGAIYNLARTIFDWFGKIPGFVSGVIQQVKDKFNSLPGAVKAVLGGMYSAITSPFVAGFNWILDKIGAIVSAFNSMKNMINGESLGMAQGVTGIANKAIEAAKLPKMSSGGFTGRGGMYEPAGIVHKGEYVLPKSMVDQSTGTPKQIGSSSNVNVTINLSGVMTDSTAGLREVGKKLIRAVNDELKSKGQQPIAGGAL